MQVCGIITEYNPKNGGYGIISCIEQPTVRFERFECNYETIRVNDKVQFDLFKSSDGIFDALNIEFISNSDLSELDTFYQKQIPFICKIQTRTPKGYIVAYKNITLFLPDKLCFGEVLKLDGNREFYLHIFSKTNKFIVSLKSKINTDVLKAYIPYKESQESILFEIYEIDASGILMVKDDFFGFVPNTHIVPFEKENLKIGDELFVKVISCSVSNGLILSIRNHYANDTIQKLSSAFKNQEVLIGKVLSTSNKVYLVNYLSINLKLNYNYIHSNNIKVGNEIPFKIIDFSASSDISISNIEATDLGILAKYESSNFFKASVVAVKPNGLIVALNDSYKSAFLPIKELTSILDKDRILNQIDIGSLINCSITRFDCQGLYVSRIKFKKYRKREIASSNYKINDKVEVKVKEKMSFFGFLVENDSLKGLISIYDIVPNEVREVINFKGFINSTKNIIKRNSKIKCIVSRIENDKKQICLEFDLTDKEMEQRIYEMLTFFTYDIELYNKMKIFYNEKKEKQIGFLK